MEKKEFHALVKKAEKWFWIISCSAIAIGIVILITKNTYACYEKKTETTPVISEGCGNRICDLNEYKFFLKKGATVCIDCFLVPHCRVMDYNSESNNYFVDWNGTKKWVPKVLDFCQIDLNNNPFVVGDIEYSWDGAFTGYKIGNDKTERCKKVFN